MIKLHKQSLDLLLKCLQKHSSDLIPLVQSPSINYYPDHFYNQLRQIVGNELIINGLNEDGEPNEYGIQLEYLIDELGRLFM